MNSVSFPAPTSDNRSTRLPACDPDSPDAEILGGYEQLRSHVVSSYARDDLDDWPKGNIELVDAVKIDLDEKITLERQVLDNFGITIPGTIAKLLLLIPQIDQDRWVERCLCEQGFLALYRRRDELNAHAQLIADAVDELIHIEWEQALAAYEKASADFNLALEGKGLAEGEFFPRSHGDTPDPFGERMLAFFSVAEDQFCNSAALRRLVRTLVPDHDAYLRKVDIIIAEGYAEDATPWLARDTNFLVGRIEGDAAPKKGAH